MDYTKIFDKFCWFSVKIRGNPEESGEYIITYENTEDDIEPGERGIAFAYYSAVMEEWYGGYKVIAWTPEPEPYKEDENE